MSATTEVKNIVEKKKTNVVEETMKATKAEEPKAPKKEKKPRAPRARKPEELISEATKNMSDKEKDILIKFLKENTTMLKNKMEELNRNIESAYRKANQLEEQYKSMEAFYQENLKYIDGQVVAMVNAVRKSTVGGVM